MSQITDKAQRRAARQRLITDACRWSEAIELITLTNVRIAFAWQRNVWRLLFGAILVFGLSGCLTLDGQQINQAQAELLKTRAAMEGDRLHYQATIARELSRIADRSDDPVVQAWAIASIERIAGPQPLAQQPQLPAQQDGPITAAVRAFAPYVLPLAQLWVQREAGRDNLKFQRQQLATSVDLESLRLGLIDSMAGRIARDPLIVTQPAPTIVEQPAPVILPPIIVGAP